MKLAGWYGQSKAECVAGVNDLWIENLNAYIAWIQMFDYDICPPLRPGMQKGYLTQVL